MIEQDETAVRAAAAYAPVSARQHVAGVAPTARRFAVCVAVWAVAALVLPASLWLGVSGARVAQLPPCPTEDAVTDCYWDAATRGHGDGRSFEVRDGVIRYADGETVTIPAEELEGVGR